MITVGDIVYKARRDRNVSQDELCSKAGLSRTMLSYIENGRRSPSLDTLNTIAKALGYDLNITFEERSEITEIDLKGIF